MLRLKLDRIQLSDAGVRALLQSPGMLGDVRGRAQRIADAAGPGHVVDAGTTGRRARAAVVTDTFDARFKQAKNHNLTRAIDRGRG